MNKFLRIGYALFLLNANGVLAAEDYGVTVGIKATYMDTEFKSDAKDSDFTLEATSQDDEEKGHGAVVLGPSLVFRYQRFLFGYNQGGGNFLAPFVASESFDDPLFQGQKVELSGELELDRTETDIYLGYVVNNNLSLVLGRKQIKLSSKIRFTEAKALGQTYTASELGLSEEKDESNNKGNFFGLAAKSTPSQNGFLFYGTFAMASFDSDGGNSGDSRTTLYEMGVGYIPRKLPLFLSFSFRGQIYSYSDSDSEGEISYFGFGTSVNYTF